MKSCSDYQKILLLDVYGELNPAERSVWEKHLSTCEHCRTEKAHLLHLIKTIKVTMPIPALSPEKIAEHVRSITGTLREDANLPWWRKVRFYLPYRLIPALATACLLLIIMSWFGVKEFKKAGMMSPSPRIFSEEQINRDDLEVVKNLDFLKEMEDVEKLVEVLDKTDSPDVSSQQKNNIDYGGSNDV